MMRRAGPATQDCYVWIEDDVLERGKVLVHRISTNTEYKVANVRIYVVTEPDCKT